MDAGREGGHRRLYLSSDVSIWLLQACSCTWSYAVGGTHVNATHQNVDAPADLFTEQYPNLAEWVLDGWIEIGRNGYSTSPIRVCDEGGLVWEGGTRHKSMDNILAEADQAISEWMKEN